MQQVAAAERGREGEQLPKTSATYLIATRGLCPKGSASGPGPLSWPGTSPCGSQLTACLGKAQLGQLLASFFWQLLGHEAYTLYSLIERSQKLLHTFRRRLKNHSKCNCVRFERLYEAVASLTEYIQMVRYNLIVYFRNILHT